MREGRPYQIGKAINCSVYSFSQTRFPCCTTMQQKLCNVQFVSDFFNEMNIFCLLGSVACTCTCTVASRSYLPILWGREAKVTPHDWLIVAYKSRDINTAWGCLRPFVLHRYRDFKFQVI